MAKTLVCIVEEEAILNYLFIKEMLEQDDKVLLIAQYKHTSLLAHFSGLFPQVEIDSIVLAKDGDEDLWDTICRTIRARLSPQESYAVNLSSGTRLMSIAVQQVFERFSSQFYFMPLDRNVIIHSQIDDQNDNNDDIVTEIKHRVTIQEYLKVHDIHSKRHSTTQEQEYSKHMLELHTNNCFSAKDFQLLEALGKINSKFIKYGALEGLEKFISYIAFRPEQSGGITQKEAKYLTGGWFEEYIYFAVSEMIKVDDIATGVFIQRNENHNNDNNELDVVFTLKNRLFVIECKTGVGKEKRYHKIVYKACALHESLLGIRSNAYIFSLNNDPDDRLKTTAHNMDIIYCDRTFAQQPAKLMNLFNNPKMWL